MMKKYCYQLTRCASVRQPGGAKNCSFKFFGLWPQNDGYRKTHTAQIILIKMICLIILILLTLAFTVEKSLAAIRFDATSNSGISTAVSSLTFSHTVGFGPDSILVVGVSSRDATAADLPVTGITYNGVPLTKIRADQTTPGDVLRTEIWYLVKPALGAHNVVISFTGTVDKLAFGVAISLFGVNQGNPVDSQNTATGVGPSDVSVNLTTVMNNTWGIDMFNCQDDTGVTVGAGQAERANLVGGVNTDAVGASTEPKTSPGTLTMSWTNVAATEVWVVSAVSFKPSRRVIIVQ